ncbi:MAG: hypothetical protein K940chlam7_01693 [Chlamydiae bacterium]|nr:hypothetical protein [Chlamydiota bacterium]
MSIEASSSFGGYVDSAMQIAPYVAEKTANLYEKASHPGETQKSVQAGIRSMIGIASIYFSPGAAVVGALAASYKPDAVTSGCQFAEGAITGFWNKLPFRVKLLLSAGGITTVAIYDPTTIFKGLSILFAGKLGAELGVRNFRKENVAAEVKKIEEQHPVEDL